MTFNFVSFRWWNTQSNVWTTDYINTDDNDHCVITSIDKSNKCTFCIARHLSSEIYILLDEIVRKLLTPSNGSLHKMKVINLGLNSQGDVVRGSFELLPVQEPDE